MRKKYVLAMILSLVLVLGAVVPLSAMTRTPVQNNCHAQSIHGCCTTRSIPYMHICNDDCAHELANSLQLSNTDTFIITILKEENYCLESILRTHVLSCDRFGLGDVNEFTISKFVITADDILMDWDTIMPFFTCCSSPTMNRIMSHEVHIIQHDPPPRRCIAINVTHTFQCQNCGATDFFTDRFAGCGIL